MIIERLSVPEPLADLTSWPFTVPAVRALVGEGIRLSNPVTFLVGENGSGKSTVIEALAEAWGVDVRGGRAGTRYSSELSKSILGEALRLDRDRSAVGMTTTRAKGFFLRAETALDVFTRLDFGEAFTEASHGESFIAAFEGFGDRGLYLLDEPEAALSFTACLSLIGALRDLEEAGSQVVCATHSPLLTALPGSSILEFDDHGVHRRRWEELEIVQHWRRYLDDPGRYLRHL